MVVINKFNFFYFVIFISYYLHLSNVFFHLWFIYGKGTSHFCLINSTNLILPTTYKVKILNSIILDTQNSGKWVRYRSEIQVI